jgi:hypothetical protein
MNIKAIKLTTGEDIIAEIEYLENDFWKLKNPVQVSMVPSRSSGQPTFGFIPFPLTSNDKEVKINSSHIMFECEPAEEFLHQYNTLFGNIVTPTTGLILN